MSLIAHLEELRWMLIRCFCVIIIFAIPSGIFWQYIFDFIAVWPLRLSEPTPAIIFTAPAEAIMFVFKIALTCGTLLASPFIFQQIWSFVAPGLYKKEKVVILPIVIASNFCFLLGISFCYFLLPLFIKFLIGFAGSQIDPLFKVSEYFSFLIRTCFAFGIAFELPVVAFILSKMGVIDHRFLIRYFRHAIIIIFIAAAILTPPDVLTQVLLALPLVALYGISIIIAYLARRRESSLPAVVEDSKS